MSIQDITRLNRIPKNVFLASLVLIGSIALYNWAVSPHVACLLAACRYRSALQKKVETNKSLAEDIRARKKKLQQLSRELERLRRTLFSPDQLKLFLNELRTASEESDCRVRSLNLSTRKTGSTQRKGGGPARITANKVTLSVEGFYGDIIRLVKKLQQRKQKVWIDSIKMTDSSKGSGRLRCDMKITAYTVQDKEISK